MGIGIAFNHINVMIRNDSYNVIQIPVFQWRIKVRNPSLVINTVLRAGNQLTSEGRIVMSLSYQNIASPLPKTHRTPFFNNFLWSWMYFQTKNEVLFSGLSKNYKLLSRYVEWITEVTLYGWVRYFHPCLAR